MELIRIFRRELEQIGGRVVVGDIDATAPALYFAHRTYLLPAFRSSDIIEVLVDVCKKEEIDFIIPLLDPELQFYTEHFQTLSEQGIRILMPAPDFVRMSGSKLATWNAFREAGLLTPEIFSWDDQDIRFPVLLKPDRGSAGKGIYLVRNKEQLEAIRSHILREDWKDYMIQQFVEGDEITTDVMTDFSGNPLFIVQRMRLKIRGGEVERGKTVFIPGVEKKILDFVQRWQPAGVFNVQCFVREEKIWFTEINARFGGGYPLSYRAGANFPRALAELYQGKKLAYRADYRKDLYMLRFDGALYLPENELFS